MNEPENRDVYRDEHGAEVDELLSPLRERTWGGTRHAAALERALLEQRAAGSSARKRTVVAGIGAVALASAAAAGVAAWGWRRVTTRVDGGAPVPREVETEGDVARFRVPVGTEPDRFRFEIEGSEAPWITFEIEVRDGVAEVVMQEHDAYPFDPAAAHDALSQARDLARRDGGALWGVDLDGPLILADSTSRFVVANQADADGWLWDVYEVYVGRLPDTVGVANTTTDWAGVRWTMLAWPIPSDAGARGRLLMHESFHRVQRELGLWKPSAPCAHLDELEGRLWLRLEARALTAALESAGEARGRAAVDALLFRAMRRAQSPGSAESEDALEHVEGTAEYTGVKLGGQEPGAQRGQVVGSLRGLAHRPGLARSFAYVTGPAWGLLLDELEGVPGLAGSWRASFASSSFGERAASALGWSVPERLEQLALERADGYGFEQVEAEEVTRDEERSARLAGYRRRFFEGPVLILPRLEPRLVFDPGGVESVGDDMVYTPLWLSDAWGVLDAAGGALVQADGTVRVPAPTDLEGPDLAGDGWSLSLAADWAPRPAARPGDHGLAPR